MAPPRTHPPRTLRRARLRTARWPLLFAWLAACAPSDFDAQDHAPIEACDADAELDGGTCPMEAGPELEAATDTPVVDSDVQASESGGEAPAGDADLTVLEPSSDAEPCLDCAPQPEAGPGFSDGSVEPEPEPSADGGEDASLTVCDGGPAACVPKELMMELRNCGGCGSGVQTRTRSCAADGCSFGGWGAWSACAGNTNVCAPGQLGSETQPCGKCNRGTKTRTRTCTTDSCSWGPWTAFGTCAEPTGLCTPGQTETQTEACGACNTGRRTRTRTCSSTTCGWGAWGAWSACGGVTAACTPGQTTACSPADSCGQRVCSASCTWGGCVPRVANGCLRRRGGTQEEGSNFRCCGDGRWQFCLPSCQWSADCAACSPDFCEC